MGVKCKISQILCYLKILCMVGFGCIFTDFLGVRCKSPKFCAITSILICSYRNPSLAGWQSSFVMIIEALCCPRTFAPLFVHNLLHTIWEILHSVMQNLLIFGQYIVYKMRNFSFIKTPYTKLGKFYLMDFMCQNRQINHFNVYHPRKCRIFPL